MTPEWNSRDTTVAVNAVAAMSDLDQQGLAQVAVYAFQTSAAVAALRRVTDQELLYAIALDAPFHIRLMAIEALTNVDVLTRIEQQDTDVTIQKQAQIRRIELGRGL